MRLEPALVQMSAATVATVEADAVRSLKPAHGGTQVRPRRLEQKVVVVEHQAVGVNRDPEPLDHLFQRLQEPLPVRILPNDRLAFVAACGHVVNRVREFHSNWSCHDVVEASIEEPTRQVSRVDPTPNSCGARHPKRLPQPPPSAIAARPTRHCFGPRFVSPKKDPSGTPLASLLHHHRESVKMAGASHGGRTTAPHEGRTPATAEAARTGAAAERQRTTRNQSPSANRAGWRDAAAARTRPPRHGRGRPKRRDVTAADVTGLKYFEKLAPAAGTTARGRLRTRQGRQPGVALRRILLVAVAGLVQSRGG